MYQTIGDLVMGDEEDIRRLYDKVAEASSKIDVFIAIQTKESKLQAERLEKLESSNKRINENFDKIKTWMLAGSLVVGSLVLIGKGAFWIYEHSDTLIEAFRHGK